VIDRGIASSHAHNTIAQHPPWYWARVDVSGIGSAARDFKAYGQNKKHRTRHERAEVASGRYTPKPGDVVSYDWKSDGTIDHVGVVISYDARTRTFTSIEGNSSDRLNKKTRVSASFPPPRSWGSRRPSPSSGPAPSIVLRAALDSLADVTAPSM
jgi:hypothetical protein